MRLILLGEGGTSPGQELLQSWIELGQSLNDLSVVGVALPLCHNQLGYIYIYIFFFFFSFLRRLWLQNLKILKNIFEISWKEIYIYILRRIRLQNLKNLKNIFEISWKEIYIYIYIYIYVWDMLYVYTHKKYNYLFQKTKEKIDFQKISKIN